MSSQVLELTQQVVPAVDDVTPEPQHRQILEVDMQNRVVCDGYLFAA